LFPAAEASTRDFTKISRRENHLTTEVTENHRGKEKTALRGAVYDSRKAIQKQDGG
jgi:hypothetical protein